MHPLVEEYLAKSRIKNAEESNKEKEKRLIELGLFEKEYAPDNQWTSEYPEVEYKGQAQLHYRKKPVEVTDEEYAQILDVSEHKPKKVQNSGLSTFFEVLGFLSIIGGIILGFVLETYLVCFIVGTMEGVLNFAISNILFNLNEIKSKL